MKYLVSHQGRELGPLTADEIVTLIRARELEAIDYAFDEQKQDWVLLAEISDVTARLKPAPKPAPKAPPRATEAEAPGPEVERTHAVTEWFILKGQTRFGPFDERGVIELLQQKALFAFDFCWHEGLDGWTRVASVPAFHPDNVREMSRRKDKSIVPRQHVRVSFSAPALVHDEHGAWRAETRELSRGGLGLVTECLAFSPGQTVRVHVAGAGAIPAFNAVCEVVAKTFVTDGSPVQYGLRFLELSDDARQSIRAKVA